MQAACPAGCREFWGAARVQGHSSGRRRASSPCLSVNHSPAVPNPAPAESECLGEVNGEYYYAPGTLHQYPDAPICCSVPNSGCRGPSPETQRLSHAGIHSSSSPAKCSLAVARPMCSSLRPSRSFPQSCPVSRSGEGRFPKSHISPANQSGKAVKPWNGRPPYSSMRHSSSRSGRRSSPTDA